MMNVHRHIGYLQDASRPNGNKSTEVLPEDVIKEITSQPTVRCI